MGPAQALDRTPRREAAEGQKPLRAEAEAPLHAFTLKVLRRPLAVLLLSSTGNHPCDLDSLSIVMTLTGLCIENLSLKIMQEISAAPADKAKKPAASPSAVRGFCHSI